MPGRLPSGPEIMAGHTRDAIPITRCSLNMRRDFPRVLAARMMRLRRRRRGGGGGGVSSDLPAERRSGGLLTGCFYPAFVRRDFSADVARPAARRVLLELNNAPADPICKLIRRPRRSLRSARGRSATSERAAIEQNVRGGGWRRLALDASAASLTVQRNREPSKRAQHDVLDH